MAQGPPPATAQPKINERLNGSIPVLKYFPAKGRGEPIRLLFEDQGIKYEDIRIHHASWAAEKAHLLESGASLYGQLPVVILDGVTLNQTLAILRFFARIYGQIVFSPSKQAYHWLTFSPSFSTITSLGLYGSNVLEAYVVDQAIDGFGDVMKEAVVLFGKDPKDEALRAAYIAKEGPEQLILLSKIISAKGGPFLLGDKLSFPDLVLFSLLDLFRPHFPNMEETYKPLGTFIRAVGARPRIAAYLASGRVPKH